MSLRSIKVAVFTLILGLRVLIAAPLQAQVSGATISGIITDPQGAVVPNSKVSVRNIDTDILTDTMTNADGAYTVPNLKPADYDVSVSAPGFNTTVAKVTLTVGAKQELNISITVGNTQQEIRVTAAAPTVELESSTISGDVEGTEVRELPLNGRDWASLATLQPSVAEVRMHPTGTQSSRGLGLQLTVSGSRPTQNVYRVDGGIVNDYSNAGPGSVLGQNLGVDAIDEFTVLTSNYSAEYGFTAGGVINAVTRSGTNTFHGSAFDFFRNDVLDATNFFNSSANGLSKNPLKQNQFGASGGWRVLRDKFFLFGDYEGVRRSEGKAVQDFTFSNAAHAGTVTNLTTGSTSTVPIDPYIQKYLALYPAPNGPAVDPNVGQYNFEAVQRTTENFVTFRGDAKISTKDNLFATFIRDLSFDTIPDDFQVARGKSTAYRQAIILEETHSFSASVVNSIRLALDRSQGLSGHFDSKSQAINPAAADPTLAMVPGPSYFAPGASIQGTGLTDNPGGMNGDTRQDLWSQLFQVYDDAFVTRGNHGLKFGFEFIRQHNDARVVNGTNGDGTFTGGLSTPIATQDCSIPSGGIDSSCGGIVNFLSDQVRVSNPPQDLVATIKHYLRDSVFGGYVQDDWHIRRSLTLNLGIRYEMQTNITEKYGNVAYLSTLTSPSTDLRHSFFTHNPTLKNFEPRIGFAWDPFHNGKTAVRGGFGLFDALPAPYALQLYAATTAPFLGNLSLVGPPNTPSPAQGVWPYGIKALAGNGTPQQQTWGYVDNNPKRNYVSQWNFNIQRELTPNTTLLVGYAGSRGFHSPFLDDSANTVLPTKVPGVGYVWPIPYTLGPGGAGNAALLNPNVGMIRSVQYLSDSWYNGLQVKLDKKMSHGFAVEGSFTWSKSIDDSSGSAAGDTFLNDYSTPPWYDMSLNKGLSGFNIGRNLVINAIWDTPTPKNQFASHAIGGWEFGIITELSDGVPLFPTIGLDQPDLLGEIISTVNPPENIGGPGCSSPINPGNVDNYIKAQCFGLVPLTSANAAFCDSARGAADGNPGTCPNIRGNLGRNTIIGPGLFNIDFSAIKNNYIKRISESFNLQFRGEFFNVLNHPNFAPPGVNSLTGGDLELINGAGQLVPGFGRIVATQTPNRIIQLALKMVW
jgi:carboxypeptidase family protein